MSIQTPRQKIIMIEDSPEDFTIAKRAFQASKLTNPLLHFETGDDALVFLMDLAKNPIKKIDLPGLILLDLNLPRTNGYEVLKMIKANDRLKIIPVIVLTTSDDPMDVEKCYKAGANSYVKKPIVLEEFFRAIAKLKDYWLEIVLLPQE